MRRLWRLWRDRRIVHGRHFDVKIEGHWWSPTARKAATLTAHLCDCFAEEFQEQHRQGVRHSLLHGESYSVTRKHFAPDEWPFPDEDPPDPL